MTVDSRQQRKPSYVEAVAKSMTRSKLVSRARAPQRNSNTTRTTFRNARPRSLLHLREPLASHHYLCQSRSHHSSSSLKNLSSKGSRNHRSRFRLRKLLTRRSKWPRRILDRTSSINWASLTQQIRSAPWMQIRSRMICSSQKLSKQQISHQSPRESKEQALMQMIAWSHRKKSVITTLLGLNSNMTRVMRRTRSRRVSEVKKKMFKTESLRSVFQKRPKFLPPWPWLLRKPHRLA